MTPRNILLIVAALLTAGGTVYFVQNWLNSERAAISAMRNRPVEKKPETFVLVAKKSLPAGTFVKPDHLRWQAWPEKNIASEYFVKGKVDLKQFTGSVVRRGIAAGEPVTVGRVVKAGDRGFLAAVLTPGMRAISVPVNATTGIAGLVFPGDRVDLLLTTQTKRKVGTETRVQRATETVLTAVRVLAVDQRTDDQGTTPKLAKTATLEVTPKQAEMISVAAELGRLSLILRSLGRQEPFVARNGKAGPVQQAAADSSAPPKRGTSLTLDTQASRMLRRNSGGPSSQRQVHVLRGSTSEQLSFSVKGFLKSTAKGMRSMGQMSGGQLK